MVHVIEDTENAGRKIEFRVYQSGNNPNLILGQWQHDESVANGSKGMIAIASETLGRLMRRFSAS